MFYRRKMLLGLLEAIGCSVPYVDFQKYMFLVCIRQAKPAYEFVPHRLGCFSFQMDSDKRTLTKYGVLKNNQQWVLGSNGGYQDQLLQSDRRTVEQVTHDFANLRGKDLVRHVYRAYPYYAINSEIRHEILNVSEQKKVNASRPRPGKGRLFTIGYEGKSLEGYLNELIAQAITAVCDIRKNAVSKKYGFSKSQFKGAIEAMGMTYIHMPELGIDSKRRQNLRSHREYRSLFEEYDKNTLNRSQKSVSKIIDMIQTCGRLALTCFEADHNWCHRGRFVEALERRREFHHRAVHL